MILLPLVLLPETLLSVVLLPELLLSFSFFPGPIAFYKKAAEWVICFTSIHSSINYSGI